MITKRDIILFTLFISSIGIIFIQGCEQPGSDKSSSAGERENKEISEKSELREKGKNIAAHLNSALIGALTKAIDREGLAGAVGFCSLRALPITDSISSAEGVSIQRVSHKPRNTNNTANETELEIIQSIQREMEGKNPQKRTFVISEDGKNTFYAPIFIASQLCLNCHGKVGTDIQPEVYKTIQTHYPNDQATGFEMNDLRGLLKVSGIKK